MNIQEQIITSDAERIVLNCCAAAGKTYVLTERIRYLIQERGYNPEEIYAITFTRTAAAEMRNRLGSIADKCFIGTVHSLAYQILNKNKIDVSKYVEEADFDKFFAIIKGLIDKDLFIKPEIRVILLDEAQDSNEQQLDFILEYLKPKEFFIVGDIRQSLYGFTGARPDLFFELFQRSDITTYNLSINHRNDRQILNYAKKLLGYGNNSDDSISKSLSDGKVVETEHNFNVLLKYLQEYNDYKNWFVLARTNAQVQEAINFLELHNIPYDTFKQADLTRQDLDKKMEENTVKVLTIHAAKGLEADYVYVFGQQYYNPEEKRVNYVAATRARHLLIWSTMPKKKYQRKKKIDYMLETWE